LAGRARSVVHRARDRQCGVDDVFVTLRYRYTTWVPFGDLEADDILVSGRD
jgi:hypothetical protein